MLPILQIGKGRDRDAKYFNQSYRENVNEAGIPPLVCLASRPMLSLRVEITMDTNLNKGETL